MLLIVASAGVGPLTDAQAAQLATAQDNSPILDEAALYPLLQNALTWPEHDEAGAMIPDYAAIRQRPADYRGELFLIEGQLARAESVSGLARPGPWDGKLEQWVVKWGPTIDDVAVVYLLDPPASVRSGREVRLVARFYKLWQTRDTQNQPSKFLTFVGHTAKVTGRDTASGVTDLSMLVLIVVLLLGAYLMLRRRTATVAAPTVPQPSKRQPDVAHGGEDAEDVGSPLPDDPAEALRQLQRRHGE